MTKEEQIEKGKAELQVKLSAVMDLETEIVHTENLEERKVLMFKYVKSMYTYFTAREELTKLIMTDEKPKTLWQKLTRKK